jgi:hypothetical protein
MQGKFGYFVSFIGGLTAVYAVKFVFNTLHYQHGLYSHLLGKQVQCKLKHY